MRAASSTRPARIVTWYIGIRIRRSPADDRPHDKSIKYREVFPALDSFCAALAKTPLSQTLQSTDWIIPAVQTVHIIAVAAVIASILMVDLRLMGVGARNQQIAAVVNRYLPSVWYALPILLLSGATLIIAEPSRALQNPVFALKMGLLLLAMGITLLCQLPLRKDARFWDESKSRRWTVRVIACLSLPLWVAILFAGRWIAYVQTG